MEDPAIARFKEMLARDPRSMAFAPLAEAYRKGGRLDEAIATAEAGLRAHPGYLGGLVVLGRSLFDKGDIPKAYEILGKVVRQNPDNYMAAKTMAKIHILRGEPHLAITAYRTVRALMPGDREVEEELARLESENPPSPAPAAVSPRVPPPPAPAARPPSGGGAAPLAPSRVLDLPPEEPSVRPPEVKATAEVPLNPFAPDEEVHSLLGDVGNLSGDEVEAPLGIEASMPFVEELPAEPPGPVPELPLGEIGTVEEDRAGAPVAPAHQGERAALAQAPAQAPPPAPPPAAAFAPLATETIARLYAQQGAVEEARKVREEMGKPPAAAPSPTTLPPGEPAPTPSARPLPGSAQVVEHLSRWLAGVERMRRR